MIKEAIEKIQAIVLDSIKVIEINHRKYSTKDLYPILEPLPTTLKIRTLTGLKSYVQNNIDGINFNNSMVYVQSPYKITLISNLDKFFSTRAHLISSELELKNHNFNVFLEMETFIIWMLSAFVRTNEIEEILKIVGNIKSERVRNISDDGFTQTVEAKKGITKIQNASITSNVILKPYRTFPEIEQPESNFLLRLREKKDSMPECALFLADGDMWEITAIHSIRDWFQNNLPEIKTIA